VGASPESAGGIAGTNTLGLAEGALARRWPADWFSRYDRPVARVLRQGTSPLQRDAAARRPERAIVATGSDAQAFPVRWPDLVGRPLPPVTEPTSAMGGPARPATQ
jgi:hypothetical protein